VTAESARTPRWVGVYVIWWGGDDWEFTQCVRCDEPLRSAAARKAGYGASCANVPGIESLKAARLRTERALCAERLRTPQGAPVYPHNRVGRRQARVKRLRPQKPPSKRQLGYLATLAREAGITCPQPNTSRDAHAHITLLLARLGRPQTST
jgi:hypothetical protein